MFFISLTRISSTISMAVVLCLAAFFPASAQPPAASPVADPAGTSRHDGISPDGSAWAVAAPANWNGILLLYSRGGDPANKEPPTLAPRGAMPILLEHGYALASTLYAPKGWDPAGGALSQFAALPGITAAIGKPKHVINVSTSYGGGVGAQEVERTKGEIDASLLTCGLIVGGIDLMNAQLDAMHAIVTLLAPDRTIRMVGLRGPSDIGASAKALTALVRAALATPQGRARIALAAALMHLPDWHNQMKPDAGNIDTLAEQQAAWLTFGMGSNGDSDVGVFAFLLGSRLDIEQQAGGNPSWNIGVDYTALLKTNAARPLVEAMYRKAGLDLGADLKTLTRTAKIAADPAALLWMQPSSVPSGDIRVPVLAMQTTGDPVAPPEFLTLYAERVKAHGKTALLRTVAVDRPGHCAFKPEEILAGVEAVQARLAHGDWGKVATPVALDKVAGEGAAFVPASVRPFAIHSLEPTP